MTRSSAKLKLVRETEVSSPSEILATLIPMLAKAEREVAMIRQRVQAGGRLLAKERGVAFIREEHLRQEFATHLNTGAPAQ